MKTKFCNIIAIAHGKSEVIFCQNIRANLRLPMNIISNNNGRSSIQVNGLNKFLSSGNFSSPSSLLKAYPNLSKNKSKLSENVRIFTLMDLDDCCHSIQKQYYTKSLFHNNAFQNYIYPIFSIPNLDDVLIGMGYPIDRENKAHSYEKVFPAKNGDFDEALLLKNKFCSMNNTNMNIFLEHCLEEVETRRL